MRSVGAGGEWPARGFGRRLAILVLAVEGMLLASGIVHGYAAYQESLASTARLKREQALATASIAHAYLDGIVRQIYSAVPPSGAASTPKERRDGFLRVLRQAPEIRELYYVDGSGQAVVGLSRLAMNWAPGGSEYLGGTILREARAQHVYYGPLTLRNISEPWWPSAVADWSPDGGVTVAWAGLKVIWDVVGRVQVGQAGRAYIVDGDGRLVAHPNINLVIQRTDVSALPQVKAALAASSPQGLEASSLVSGRDLEGDPVLSTAVALNPPGWLLFVEQPQEEVLFPVYATVLRTGLLLVVGLAVALLASWGLART
ncbi:MAG TPA: hypothetical protein VII06_15590 [Chloroflexota bacterium]|jgi:hypothetical protein